MRRTRGIWLVAAALLVLGVALGALAAGTARAASVVVLPRPGQVGAGVSGLYGTLLKSGSVGSQFGSGPGMAVRLRYRMRYERGFGLSFENHGLDPRPGDQKNLETGEPMAATSVSAYKRLDLSLFGADFYQMFGTRTKTTKMLSVGGGLAHPVFPLNGGDLQVPPFGDGVYLSAGAGLERFFWQSVAFDLGARYQAVFLDGKANHDLQLSVGFIMYASL
jgi:opacity protein-like surface antigen